MAPLPLQGCGPIATTALLLPPRGWDDSSASVWVTPPLGHCHSSLGGSLAQTPHLWSGEDWGEGTGSAGGDVGLKAKLPRMGGNVRDLPFLSPG
jgi:hypothetical protein